MIRPNPSFPFRPRPHGAARQGSNFLKTVMVLRIGFYVLFPFNPNRPNVVFLRKDGNAPAITIYIKVTPMLVRKGALIVMTQKPPKPAHKHVSWQLHLSRAPKAFDRTKLKRLEM